MKKFWYIQDWGTYTCQTPVFVGYTPKEMLKVMKKQNWNKEVVKKFEGECEELTEYAEGKNGFVWSYEGWTLLSFPHWKGTWDDIETLVHECFHLVVAQLAKSKAFVRSTDDIEEEGMAYQLEYLFRNIRIRLETELKKKK